jgi:hypothetical protein
MVLHLHGGLPPGSPIRDLGGDVPRIYRGPTYCSDGFPCVVFSAHGPPDDIPQLVYRSHGPPIHRFPHVLASVRLHQDFPSALVVSLAHENQRSSLAFDVTMSLSVPGQAVPPHLASTTAQPGVIPPVASQLSPLMWVYGSVPHIMPQGVMVPPLVAPAPAAPTPATRSVDPSSCASSKTPSPSLTIGI